MNNQAAEPLLVCDADALLDGGRGLRFAVTAFGDAATGFVVRYEGKVYGYLNRCAHVPIELDWAEGEFFESSGLYLMCSTHGAVYVPDSGLCASGPCKGGRLRPIAVREENDKVYWQPDEFIHAPQAQPVQQAQQAHHIPIKPQHDDL
jgi:nitrite reductase/ring-hydroxylating ferredoxin subunit